jgi:hypothetical protein
MSEHVRDITRRVAQGWLDERGHAWTERALLLRRALERDSDAALDLSRAIDRATDASSEPAAPHGQPPGPRLGDTGARRADDSRGVRIPRLDDGPRLDDLDGSG